MPKHRPPGRCPQCRSRALLEAEPGPTIKEKPIPCAGCAEELKDSRCNLFVCLNHQQPRAFCNLCVLRRCSHKACQTEWHSAGQCTNVLNRLKPVDNLVFQVPPNPRSPVDHASELRLIDHHRNNFICIIEQMKVHDPTAALFREVEHPHYCSIVTDPIHFGQILKKLHSDQYVSIADVLSDIERLWSNCYAFNGSPPSHSVYRLSFSAWASRIEWILKTYLGRLADDMVEQRWIASTDVMMDRMMSPSLEPDECQQKREVNELAPICSPKDESLATESSSDQALIKHEAHLMDSESESGFVHNLSVQSSLLQLLSSTPTPVDQASSASELNHVNATESDSASTISTVMHTAVPAVTPVAYWTQDDELLYQLAKKRSRCLMQHILNPENEEGVPRKKRKLNQDHTT